MVLLILRDLYGKVEFWQDAKRRHGGFYLSEIMLRKHFLFCSVYFRQQLENINRRLTSVVCVQVLYAHKCSRDKRGILYTCTAEKDLRDPPAQPTHFTDEESHTFKGYVTGLRAYSY